MDTGISSVMGLAGVCIQDIADNHFSNARIIRSVRLISVVPVHKRHVGLIRVKPVYRQHVQLNWVLPVYRRHIRLMCVTAVNRHARPIMKLLFHGRHVRLIRVIPGYRQHEPSAAGAQAAADHRAA